VLATEAHDDGNWTASDCISGYGRLGEMERVLDDGTWPTVLAGLASARKVGSRLAGRDLVVLGQKARSRPIGLDLVVPQSERPNFGLLAGERVAEWFEMGYFRVFVFLNSAIQGCLSLKKKKKKIDPNASGGGRGLP